MNASVHLGLSADPVLGRLETFLERFHASELLRARATSHVAGLSSADEILPGWSGLFARIPELDAAMPEGVKDALALSILRRCDRLDLATDLFCEGFDAERRAFRKVDLCLKVVPCRCLGVHDGTRGARPVVLGLAEEFPGLIVELWDPGLARSARSSIERLVEALQGATTSEGAR